MNGGGRKFVAPGHLRGEVGRVVTLVCRANTGHAEIASLAYGPNIVTAAPFSITVLPGMNTCSVAVAADRADVSGEVLEQYPGGFTKLADFGEEHIVSFLVEGGV